MFSVLQGLEKEGGAHWLSCSWNLDHRYILWNLRHIVLELVACLPVEAENLLSVTDCGSSGEM